MEFPTKPVTLIVPYSAGGGTDSVARAIANSAEDHLGQSIGVVNKTGGGGAVGMTEGAIAKPDGYTMTMLTVEVTMLPHLGMSKIKLIRILNLLHSLTLILLLLWYLLMHLMTQ